MIDQIISRHLYHYFTRKSKTHFLLNPKGIYPPILIDSGTVLVLFDTSKFTLASLSWQALVPTLKYHTPLAWLPLKHTSC